MPPEPAGHRTVLLHEAIESLAIQEDDIVVDATLGGAGHAKAIFTHLGADGLLIGFDADRRAIERAHSVLDTKTNTNIKLVNANFRTLDTQLDSLAVPFIDKALFDLGWSTFQLHEGRGFSFLSDEPLSMAYADDQTLTADTIVNSWSEESLADVIYGWGEERYSRRIASAIVAARERAPIKTARELGEIVKAAVPPPYRFGRIHPATKTFQALRIAVNDELGALQTALRQTWNRLNTGGRIAVITFHSIEDRLVKQQFVAWEGEGSGKRIPKKAIAPSKEEVMANPRSRSAKLRIIEKKSI